MTCFYSTFELPPAFGSTFSAAVDEKGAVVATAFGDRRELQRRMLFSKLVHDPVAIAPVRDEVLQYAGGCRTGFTVPLKPLGSDFQHRVWQNLRAIPFGETRTYGQIAAELGGSPRAVGRANATNPICLIIPCHRVIGADGSLTGFAFGEMIKRALLDHERSLATTNRRAG